MPVPLKVNNVVIGKRVTLGAAITSCAAALGHFWPDHAVAFTALSVPITFIAQVVLANRLGITT